MIREGFPSVRDVPYLGTPRVDLRQSEVDTSTSNDFLSYLLTRIHDTSSLKIFSFMSTLLLSSLVEFHKEIPNINMVGA